MLSSLFLSAVLALAPAHAGSLAGVTVADTATVGGQSLVLNGMGLREKYMFDIYVGSLYLPAKTTDESKAINDDVAKRVVMSFIYKEVTKEQMVETFEEGLAKLPNKDALRDRFNTLNGMMATVHANDTVILDYVPGTGTTITFNGAAKGTIPGADFMKAVWSIYIGPNPPTKNLKKGMLGA